MAGALNQTDVDNLSSLDDAYALAGIEGDLNTVGDQRGWLGATTTVKGLRAGTMRKCLWAGTTRKRLWAGTTRYQ